MKKVNNKTKYTEQQLKEAPPVLVLRCIETYADPKSNTEYFSRNFAYHVMRFDKISLYMQTNIKDLEARIPMEVAGQIFAGFGKQDGADMKVIHKGLIDKTIKPLDGK